MKDCKICGYINHPRCRCGENNADLSASPVAAGYIAGADTTGANYTTGMIIDVFPEGGASFRGCVKRQEITSGEKYIATINLKSGEVALHQDYECSEPVIGNIFACDE